MNKNELITKAQLYLKNHAIDAAHDLEHHQNVAKNCEYIVHSEKLKVNLDTILIAAWWHDVESREGATDIIEKEMTDLGWDSITQEKICTIIQTHTYGENQQTLEGQILFDADKMEYFNPERMRKALKDAKSGMLPKETLKKHYEAWLVRYNKVLTSFHFNSSRTFAEENLLATKAEIEKIGRFLSDNLNAK